MRNGSRPTVVVTVSSAVEESALMMVSSTERDAHDHASARVGHQT
jgi:hypothetical protein